MREYMTNFCSLVMMMLSLLAMPFIVHLPASDNQIGYTHGRQNMLLISKPIQNTGKMLRAEDFTDESHFALIFSAYSFGNRRSINQVDFNKENLGSDFQPSMKILARIMKVLFENNSIGKTNLSLEANIQYSRLLKHIEWLEKKRLVESIIEEGKINFKLTSLGREFATMISLL